MHVVQDRNWDLFFSIWVSSYSTITYWKTFLFPWGCFGSLLRWNDHITLHLFWLLYSVASICLWIFMAASHCLAYCSFMVMLWSQVHQFWFCYCLGQSQSFTFPPNFYSLSVLPKKKKKLWDYARDYIESIDQFGENCHLTKSSSPWTCHLSSSIQVF